MYDFEMISQGGSSYLVLRLNEEDAIDELAVGMMRNNQIPGLLPMAKRWEKGGFAFYYTVSSLTPLSRSYATLGAEKRLKRFLLDYCNLQKECREYLLEPSKLLLDENYIFVRAVTGELLVPYIAVMEPRYNITENDFFNQFVHNVEGHLPPESRIRPILYEQSFRGSFAPEKVLKELSVLDDKAHQCTTERLDKKKEAPAGVQQKKAVVDILPPSAEQPAEHSKLERPASIIQAESPNEKIKKGFLGFIGSKSEKKPKAEKAAALEKRSQNVGFDSPFASAAGVQSTAKKPKAAERPEVIHKQKKSGFLGKKQPAKPLETVTPKSVSPVQEKEPPKKAPWEEQPVLEKAAVGSQQDSGYTVNLSALDSGVSSGTIHMSDEFEGGFSNGFGSAATTLWMVRRGSGERVQVTHSNFHVGRMLGGDEIVDYAVMTSTGYLGADHAYFQIKDGTFYITDNNSTNGTWLNGQKLQPSFSYEVHVGDVLKMADIVFDLTEH